MCRGSDVAPVDRGARSASRRRGDRSRTAESLTDTSAPPDLASVVVPCYCEAAGLATAVDAIRGALESSAVAYEIILVDDGSSDGTWACITALRARIGNRVRGIRLSRRFGKESAMRAGLEMARGGAV